MRATDIPAAEKTQIGRRIRSCGKPISGDIWGAWGGVDEPASARLENLLHALGAEHPLRDPCRAVVSAIGDGRVSATTTVEAIQEFVQVRARRRGRADAASLAAQYATLLAPLITVDSDDLAIGLRLFREHEQLGSFDALLVAAAVRREHITGVLSADRAFAGIGGLAHLDPADPNVLPTLGL